jgi:hypothetical protein
MRVFPFSLISGPAGHRHPRSSPLSRVCTRSQRFRHFKCILEVVYCEAVQHRLCFCLDRLSCVKMAAFQLHLQSGKHKSRMGEGQ